MRVINMNYNPRLIIRAVSRPIAVLMLTISLAGMITVAQATPTEMATYGAPGCLSCHFDGIFTKEAGQAGLAVYLASRTPTCPAPQVLQNNVCVTPVRTCPAPQVLKNNVCVTPDPTCAAPQVLQDNVCVTPVLTCAAPQVPRDNVCVSPAENGQILSSACSDCHGRYGINNNDGNNYPNINGQSIDYFLSALQQYKNGQRSDETMRAEIAPFSDQDMFDLASYYAGITVIPSYSPETTVVNMPFVQAFSKYFQVTMVQLSDGNFSVTTANRWDASVVDQWLVSEVGSEVAEAGNGLILSSACSACHGRYGISKNNARSYPNINGQKEAYFFDALQEYRNGKRRNVAMQAQVGPLSDQNMRDLAAFYNRNDAIPSLSSETQVLSIPVFKALSKYYQATMTRLPDGNFSVTTVNPLD